MHSTARDALAADREGNGGSRLEAGESGGLRLVKDADPSWWKQDNTPQRFPHPREVSVRWDASNQFDKVDSKDLGAEKATYKPNSLSTSLSGVQVNIETLIDKADSSHNESVASVSTGSESENGNTIETKGGTINVRYNLIED